jgi:hypothetical protein
MIQLEFPFMEDEPGRRICAPVAVLNGIVRDFIDGGRCKPVEHPALRLAAEALEREGYTVRRG